MVVVVVVVVVAPLGRLVTEVALDEDTTVAVVNGLEVELALEIALEVEFVEPTLVVDGDTTRGVEVAFPTTGDLVLALVIEDDEDELGVLNKRAVDDTIGFDADVGDVVTVIVPSGDAGRIEPVGTRGFLTTTTAAAGSTGVVVGVVGISTIGV